MRIALSWVAAIVPLLWNCAAQSPALYFKQTMVDRAAFDLDCPKDQLWLRNLTSRNLYYGAQVGVTGCGKRAVYVFTNGAGWVLNGISESKDAPGGPADPPNSQSPAPSASSP